MTRRRIEGEARGYAPRGVNEPDVVIAVRSLVFSKDSVYKELVASAIPNGHFVAAGVIAVTRAQEYDYSLLTAG